MISGHFGLQWDSGPYLPSPACSPAPQNPGIDALSRKYHFAIQTLLDNDHLGAWLASGPYLPSPAFPWTPRIWRLTTVAIIFSTLASSRNILLCVNNFFRCHKKMFLACEHHLLLHSHLHALLACLKILQLDWIRLSKHTGFPQPLLVPTSQYIGSQWAYVVGGGWELFAF